MKAAIFSIGTELLFGQITNTNTVFLSQQLNLLGFDVMYHYTAGDNEGRVKKLLSGALSECDLVITTGGLGPTEDDLTKETVTELLDDELVVHGESLAFLEGYAKKRGRKLTENNYKQSMMPSRAQIFRNYAGTAPGFALENEGKIVICMPGPPWEMEKMWETGVRPYLEKLQDSVIRHKMIRFFGIGESLLETKLLGIIDNQSDPTVATYAKKGECSVRVASKRNTEEEALAAIEDTVSQIREIVGEYIYSEDDEELAFVVGRKLIERNISISCCESCTGGMFAGALTDVPGISSVFDRGLVTYTYDAKADELGVSRDTLAKYTAESREVALEMVRGLREKTGSRVCVSVTGIAGPGGGTPEKPAGTIYIGCIYDDREVVREMHTGSDNRARNRNYAVLNMFDVVNRMLDGREV